MVVRIKRLQSNVSHARDQVKWTDDRHGVHLYGFLCAPMGDMVCIMTTMILTEALEYSQPMMSEVECEAARSIMSNGLMMASSNYIHDWPWANFNYPIRQAKSSYYPPSPSLITILVWNQFQWLPPVTIQVGNDLQWDNWFPLCSFCGEVGLLMFIDYSKIDFFRFAAIFSIFLGKFLGNRQEGKTNWFTQNRKSLFYVLKRLNSKT